MNASQQLVIDTLRKVATAYRPEGVAEGLTHEELEQHTGLNYNTLRRITQELNGFGHVKSVGFKPTSGRKTVKVVLTVLGATLATAPSPVADTVAV